MFALVCVVRLSGIKLPKFVAFQIAREADLLYTLGWEPVKNQRHSKIAKNAALCDNLELFLKITKKNTVAITSRFVKKYCKKSPSILGYLSKNSRVFSGVLEAMCAGNMSIKIYMYMKQEYYFGKDALIFSVKHGNYKLAQYIVAENEYEIDFQLVSSAAKSKNIKLFMLMFSRFPSAKRRLDDITEIVCSSGCLEMLKIVFPEGKKLPNVFTEYALEGGNMEIIKLLESTENMPSHLAAACKSGKIEVVQYFLDNCNVQLDMRAACSTDVPEITELLYARGANFDEQHIIIAIRDKCFKVVKFLLSVKPMYFEYALPYAATNSHKITKYVANNIKLDPNRLFLEAVHNVRTLKFFVKKGIKNLGIYLAYAIEKKHITSACYLLTIGVPYNQNTFNKACANNIYLLVKKMKENVNLEEGFWVACSNNAFKVVDYFVKRGICVSENTLKLLWTMEKILIIKVFMRNNCDFGYGILCAIRKLDYDVIYSYAEKYPEHLDKGLEAALKKKSVELIEYFIEKGAFAIISATPIPNANSIKTKYGFVLF